MKKRHFGMYAEIAESIGVNPEYLYRLDSRKRRERQEKDIQKLTENPRKIETSSAKAVYLLLYSCPIPMNFTRISEILKFSKATTYRALTELSRLGLIKKSKKIFNDNDIIATKKPAIEIEGWHIL